MATSNSNNGAGGNTATGAQIVIEAAPGQTIKLPLETLQGAVLAQQGGSLLITPANGGTPILLQDFLTFGATENPPSITLENGDVLPIQQITPLVANYSVGDITPAAGNEANSDGGGAHFQPFHEGSIGDPLGIAGLLPPTDLSFTQDTPEETVGQNTNGTTSVGSNPFATISLAFQTLPIPAAPGPVAFALAAPSAAAVGDSAVSGGYEDWQPNQNTGDYTQAPMQMIVGFVPHSDEQLTSIDISGFPAGSHFFVGGSDGAHEVDVTSGSYTVNATGGALPDMYVLAPASSDADIAFGVAGHYTNDAGQTGIVSTSGTAVIDAVADMPVLTGSDATGAEDSAISIPGVTAALTDTDGSETLSVSVGGVPAGAVLSDGTHSFIGDGSSNANVTSWDLGSLTITPPAHDASDFSLTLMATATEGAHVATGGELTDANNVATNSLTINVTVNDTPPPPPPPDDGPTAVNDGPEYITEPLITHAVFVIDTSLSLDSTQLQLMEDALKNLATTLFSQNPDGTKITLIDFDTHASFIGSADGTFDTLASTLNALDTVSTLSGGSTNYHDALTLTQTVDFADGVQPEIYFISDGQPTRGDTVAGITSFNDWISTDLSNAHVYSVGIGTDANDSQYLGQIDNTPDDNNVTPTSGGPYLYVENPGDLDGSLVTSHIELNGNVLTNDSPGTDPLAAVPITGIEYHGTSYDLSSSGSNVSVSGNVLTLDSDYGVLTINFQTGDYNYIANTDISNFQNEVFAYTISDTDGSTSTANLTVQISPDTAYTGTAGADVIMGGIGNDYIAGQGGDDSLTGNGGDDRFVYQSAASDGNDTIHDFGANGDHDVIDLSSLFDDLGINAANRADHVVFNSSGGNTVITVTDGTDTAVANFSITVENVTLDHNDIANGNVVVADQS